MALQIGNNENERDIMSNPPAAKIPLPASPTPLCFNKDHFMQDGFDADGFISKSRRNVQLEQLREDLALYLKVLRSAMVELINKDYADFVNLSSNLVGMDKAICSLQEPLGHIFNEVDSVSKAMTMSVKAVQDRLERRQRIREKKACIQRLMHISRLVTKIELMLQLEQDGDLSEEKRQMLHLEEEGEGKLIERVATEFNQLQFYVNKSKGLPLVENLKLRILSVTSSLQCLLEKQFLESQSEDTLRQCLRTYGAIDKTGDAEALFRQEIVRPFMEQVFQDQNLGETRDIRNMLNKALDFIPLHCKPLLRVTGYEIPAESSKLSDIVGGYNFLVNSVFPEIVSAVEEYIPGIFAPGNPDSFKEKYIVGMEFLDGFEQACGSQVTVKQLRSHPSYNKFHSKWSLPVYFQIRFQEIAGDFEVALHHGLTRTSGSKFQLEGTEMLWKSVCAVWSPNIFLPPLCGKLWKMTLQLFSRYNVWIKSLSAEVSTSNNNQISAASKASRKSTKAQNGLSADEADNEILEDEDIKAPEPSLQDLVLLVLDATAISQNVATLYDDSVKPVISPINFGSDDTIVGTLVSVTNKISDAVPELEAHVTNTILLQCQGPLKQVSDIPRLYRRTNREVPSKPSSYVEQAMKPMQSFISENNEIVGPEMLTSWVDTVVKVLTEQYTALASDVLIAVKRMEDSLKKLKRGNRAKQTETASGVFTDDDKIRLQICIDVQSFGEWITKMGVSAEDMKSYTALLNTVKSAQSASTMNA